MLTLSPGPSPFSSTGSLLRKSFDPNAVTVFNPQTATQPSVSCPLSSSLIPTVCGGLDDRHVQECVETTPTTAAPNARGGKNAPGASTTRQASAQQHQSSIFPGGGGLLSRPASPSRRWKTIAITAMFTGQGVVAAGYEDGAVKISRLTTEDGPNGSAATPDTLAITRSSCGTTDRLVASAADERSRVSPSSAQQPTRSSNSTNFTRVELTEGATGIKTLESTAPLSKTSRELLAAVKNAESPTAMVTSVHCVPFGANHVGLAVAYSNCVFVSLEASSLVPNTMVLQRRHIVRTRVEISSKIILESLTRPDPSHAQAAAPTGRSASRTRVPSAGASPSADKLLNAPVQVDGVLLSPCLRFVAVSVCAPQLEVLVFPLPELMTETKLTAADRPGSSHTGNEVEKRTVPPARLLAHCMYENNTKVYNSKVEAATREVPQSAISPKGSAASEAARAAREKEAKEAEKKPDAVRSKCFFLSSRADVPCSGYERRRPNPTGMLVVVWLNSYSYARIPLKESPSTFLPQLRNVAKVEAAALAAATETQVVKRKGKGGAAVKDPSPRGKRGSSAGRKGKASPHPEPPMDLPVPLFSGVLRSSSASKIEMATHTDDGSFVVLGFVGGTVQLLHSRLSLDVLSAVPPPTGSPNLGQNVTHISALHAVTHYNIDSGEADCVSLVVGTHSVTESSGEIRPVTLAPGESSPPHPECTTPVEVHFGAAFVNFAIPSHMLEHPPAPGSQVESIHAGPISARYLVGLPSRVVTAVCLRPLPFAVLFLNPQHSELISAFSLHSLALPGNSATTVLWDAALGKVLGTLPLNLMGVEGRNRSARESRASSPVLTPTAVPPARAAPVPVVLAEQCLSTSTSGGLYWIEEHLPNQPSLWQSRPASPMELRLGSPPMEPPPPSTIFPVLWPISAMLQSLYPVLHSYFPHATLAAAGVMLHLLTPAQRRDPVAVGAMDHAMIPGMNGIEHNPQEERREMLGERRSRGASSRRPTSKMSAPRQSRAMRSSPNFLHMTTACDAATLCCHNAESFGCAWLGSTSNTTEPRAMDLARVLDDLQRRA